jgi:tRNA(Ile)-lysidine synthase
MRALARLLVTVGGAEYPPRLERLARLFRLIGEKDFRGATLAGCQVLPRRGRLLVVREAARAAVISLEPGAHLLWDGRFEVTIARQAGKTAESLRLGPLGEAGWREISRRVSLVETVEIPAAARAGLPALSRRGGLLAVPHLGFGPGIKHPAAFESCVFAPKNALTDARFTVA